jgi:hypothetical protein
MKIIASIIFLICCNCSAFGQIVTVHGVVTDADSKRYLPGVSIFAGNTGTATDSTGHFKLMVQSSFIKTSWPYFYLYRLYKRGGSLFIF